MKYQDNQESRKWPLDAHLILLSSAVENWRAYFNALEQHFLESVNNETYEYK